MVVSCEAFFWSTLLLQHFCVFECLWVFQAEAWWCADCWVHWAVVYSRQHALSSACLCVPSAVIRRTVCMCCVCVCVCGGGGGGGMCCVHVYVCGVRMCVWVFMWCMWVLVYVCGYRGGGAGGCGCVCTCVLVYVHFCAGVYVCVMHVCVLQVCEWCMCHCVCMHVWCTFLGALCMCSCVWRLLFVCVCFACQ